MNNNTTPTKEENQQKIKELYDSVNQKEMEQLKEAFLNCKMFLVIRDTQAKTNTSFFLHRIILANLKIELPEVCNKKERTLVIPKDGNSQMKDLYVTEIEIDKENEVILFRAFMSCFFYKKIEDYTWYIYFDTKSRLEDFIPDDEYKIQKESELIDTENLGIEHV